MSWYVRFVVLFCVALSIALSAPLHAQTAPELAAILDRLDRLERENRALADEVRSLKSELAARLPAASPAQAPDTSDAAIEERLAVQERRIAENAQAKVEASQHFPIRITGMALFNAFWNSKANGNVQNPITASAYPTPTFAGATFRQTVIGLTFQGPKTFLGGTVQGNVFMDFFAGQPTTAEYGDYEPYTGSMFRLRTATMQIDWRNQTVMFGQDKPLISPREPNSLAQVGVSPLTGAGNLWLWLPQARFEQRFALTPATRVRAQAAVLDTLESAANVPAAYTKTLSRSRPALEGRVELSHQLGDETRIAIAPGFHTSTTHVAGVSVPSNLFSLDWLLAPIPRLDFSGAFFSGQNLAALGALRQGFSIHAPRQVSAVHGKGGWAQLSFRATKRLTFNIFGGQHDDRNSDLYTGNIAKNQSYDANFIYRLAPNVLFSFEASQVRTTYLGRRNWQNNHYDLALAYLF